MSDFCFNVVLFYPPINLSWMLVVVGMTLNYIPNNASLILHVNINAGKCNVHHAMLLELTEEILTNNTVWLIKCVYFLCFLILLISVSL